MRPAGNAALILVVFEGPIRADLVVTTPERAGSLGAETVIVLMDRDGTGKRVAGHGPETPRTPQAVLERVAHDVPSELAGLEQAIERGAVLAGFEAQTRAIRSAERMRLLLQDPVAGGSLSPKAAASALSTEQIKTLLTPLRAWSKSWPEPTIDSIDATVDVLNPLATECHRRYGIAVPVSPGSPDLSPPARDRDEVVRDALDTLIHAPVDATYFRRGLHTRSLWGRGLLARRVANLMYVAKHPRLTHVPVFADDLTDPDKTMSLAQAIRRARGGTPQALRSAGSALWALFAQTGRQAAAALKLAYPEALESVVFD